MENQLSGPRLGGACHEPPSFFKTLSLSCITSILSKKPSGFSGAGFITAPSPIGISNFESIPATMLVPERWTPVTIRAIEIPMVLRDSIVQQVNS